MAEKPAFEMAAERFEALLEPVLDMAFGVAFHMTRCREEAEDVVQEAVLLAFRARASFEPGTNFKAWFFKIMLNSFRTKYHKRKREPEIAPIEDAPDLYLYAQMANAGMLANQTNPAALVIQKMSQEQIEKAIAALPLEYRLVALLYFMEEISYQEIAEILDCPIGTVRSRLHRGRKLLQKALWAFIDENQRAESLQKGNREAS